MDHAGLTPGLEIRCAEPSDLPACAALYVRVLTDTFSWLPPERHSEADFLAAAREETVYVAVNAGRIVGLASVYAPQTFLHSLYVTERGQGIGKALLEHVIAEMGGVLQLKCQTANVRAQAFYRREGFRQVEAGQDDGIAWRRFLRG